MTERKYLVQVPAGDLAVTGFGERGPNVVFVHSVGHFSGQWSLVRWELSERARCYLVDSRGHGASNSDFRDALTMWKDIVAVVEQLELTDVILVGDEMACNDAKLAACARPELFAGLVLINPTAEVKPGDEFTQLAEDFMSILDDPSIIQRSGLGVKGSTPEELEAYLDTQCANAEADWLYGSLSDQYRELLRSAVKVYDDGSWERRPKLEELMHEVKASLEHYAKGELVVETPSTLPVWNVESTFEDGDQEPLTLGVPSGEPGVRTISLAAKTHPECTHPQEIADIIMQLADAVKAKRRSGSGTAS